MDAQNAEYKETCKNLREQITNGFRSAIMVELISVNGAGNAIVTDARVSIDGRQHQGHRAASFVVGQQGRVSHGIDEGYRGGCRRERVIAG